MFMWECWRGMGYIVSNNGPKTKESKPFETDMGPSGVNSRFAWPSPRRRIEAELEASSCLRAKRASEHRPPNLSFNG